MINIDKNYVDCCTIDTDKFIEQCLGEKINLPDYVDEANWCSDEKYNLIKFFESENPDLDYILAKSDNTYNYENDLDTVLNYHIFHSTYEADWCWNNHPLYIVIERHLGGDVRGNYGEIEVYKIESNIAESGFFDQTLGWIINHNDDQFNDTIQGINDKLSIGYSSYPTGQLQDKIKGEVTYSEKFNSFVCRFNDLPFVTKIEPYSYVC